MNFAKLEPNTKPGSTHLTTADLGPKLGPEPGTKPGAQLPLSKTKEEYIHFQGFYLCFLLFFYFIFNVFEVRAFYFHVFLI